MQDRRNGSPAWSNESDPLGPCPSLGPRPIGDLIADHPCLREPVIHDIVRRGETANIIAPPKTGKSWLAYGLALSIATGRDWLDTYRTERGRVLLIDNELHPETIAHRIPEVAAAMVISESEYQDNLHVVSLRGHLTDFQGISEIVRSIPPGTYRTVIVDAFYRALPKGVSENDNSQIAGVYNLVDRCAAETDAAWFLIHHTSKGSQAHKSVTDVGAGAGSQSRAADSHLILRPHEKDGYVVLEAATRSFPPVNPVVLRWGFPIWTPQKGMSPQALKGSKTKQEERQRIRDEEGSHQILDQLKKGAATISGICRLTGGMGKARAKQLVHSLESKGKITSKPVTVRGNATDEFRLVDAPK